MKLALMIAFGLAVATSQAKAAPSHARWMGEATCSAWPADQAYDDFDKALLLNWVLGWLSHSGKEGSDLLAKVSQASISGWVDRYCAANPNDTLISAAAKLEVELMDNARYSSL